MTPLHITMLLHYHAIAEPYALRNPTHATSPAVREFREQLLKWDLIHEDDGPSGYRTTERGKTYIDGLCNLPLPISVTTWKIPYEQCG